MFSTKLAHASQTFQGRVHLKAFMLYQKKIFNFALRMTVTSQVYSVSSVESQS